MLALAEPGEQLELLETQTKQKILAAALAQDQPLTN